MAAAMHLGLAIHNFGIQEYMKHGAQDGPGLPAVLHLDRRLPPPRRQARARCRANVDEAGKYPYEQAYLPYNRLADGTVHDW